MTPPSLSSSSIVLLNIFSSGTLGILFRFLALDIRPFTPPDMPLPLDFSYFLPYCNCPFFINPIMSILTQDNTTQLLNCLQNPFYCLRLQSFSRPRNRNNLRLHVGVKFPYFGLVLICKNLTHCSLAMIALRSSDSSFIVYFSSFSFSHHATLVPTTVEPFYQHISKLSSPFQICFMLESSLYLS